MTRQSAPNRKGPDVPRPSTGERPPLSLRTSPELRARLQAAATRSGRSISQEAEWFLERGAASSERTQGSLTKSLLQTLEYFITDLEARYGENWQTNAEARSECHRTLKSTIDLMVPIDLNVSRHTKLMSERRRRESGDDSRERVREVLNGLGMTPSKTDDPD